METEKNTVTAGDKGNPLAGKTRGQIYRQLFFSTLYLSTFTFGGGYVIVTLLKEKFVDEAALDRRGGDARSRRHRPSP